MSTREIFKQITTGPGLIDTLCDFIIRPPRSDYELDDLGPTIFRIGDVCKSRFTRHDLDLYNMRGMRIRCSWFKPLKEPEAPLPCVVYCHANCGGRYDGLETIFLLTKGFTVFCFDFCGSGMSDGEYISLGFYERQDLAAVVEYLSLCDDVDGVALWGRSMGAVTAIMYASKDDSIRCVICDSPFGSLRWLVQDLVAQHGGKAGKYIPNLIIKSIVERIRKRIMRRSGFDIDDLNTIRYAANCTVPGLIFHGEDDDFVKPKHSQAVRDAFIGSCLHQLVPGGHNDERDNDIHELITGFLRLYMVEKPKAAREAASLQAQASLAAAAGTPSGLCAEPSSGVICSYEAVSHKPLSSSSRAGLTATATSSSVSRAPSAYPAAPAAPRHLSTSHKKQPQQSSSSSSSSRGGHEGGGAYATTSTGDDEAPDRSSAGSPPPIFSPPTPPSSDLGTTETGGTPDLSILVDADWGAQPISFRKEKLSKVDCTSDLPQ